MKNVQVIDGAENCSFSVYALSDNQFRLIFPEQGQDVEFIEDVIARLGDEYVGNLMKTAWKRRKDKRKIRGIHGTLFYQLLHKKQYYPTKKESEMITGF